MKTKTLVESNEFSLSRIYDAPLKEVWEAWSDPTKVAQWWGPRGFTLTTHSKELRVGGSWDYTMHAPDGTNFHNITHYHEVEEYSRLVYDHGGNDKENRPPLFKVIVTFKEIDHKTQMDMTMILKTPEEAQAMLKYIKEANGYSTWDRLAEFLEEKINHKDIFVINRSFNTDLKTMFEMWTKPEAISSWLAPTGFKMKYFRSNIQEGGDSFYKMTNEKEITMYGKAQYLKIHSPNLLQYTQQFCDENENMARHPFAPTWPAFMLTTITFTSEEADSTRVTVRWEVFGEASTEEREMFHQAKPGMTLGWTGSFDKLEELLN